MLTSLSIGQAMHLPDGKQVYPVYFKKEYESTRTVYVSETRKNEIKSILELIFLSTVESYKEGSGSEI